MPSPLPQSEPAYVRGANGNYFAISCLGTLRKFNNRPGRPNNASAILRQRRLNIVRGVRDSRGLYYVYYYYPPTYYSSTPSYNNYFCSYIFRTAGARTATATCSGIITVTTITTIIITTTGTPVTTAAVIRAWGITDRIARTLAISIILTDSSFAHFKYIHRGPLTRVALEASLENGETIGAHLDATWRKIFIDRNPRGRVNDTVGAAINVVTLALLLGYRIGFRLFRHDEAARVREPPGVVQNIYQGPG